MQSPQYYKIKINISYSDCVKYYITTLQSRDSIKYLINQFLSTLELVKVKEKSKSERHYPGQ